MAMSRADYVLIADALRPLCEQDGPASHGARLAAHAIQTAIAADPRYGSFKPKLFLTRCGVTNSLTGNNHVPDYHKA